MKTGSQIKGVGKNLWLLCVIALFQCLIGYEKIPGPEAVLTDWLTYMSKGECEKAIDLEIEYSMEILLVPNCEPYESEIKSIICEIGEETADCACIESRELKEDIRSSYDLKKVDGVWKIAAMH